MKYYTAKEACDTFPNLIPSDIWTLRNWIAAGKFPVHDCMITRGKAQLQAWSEHTILNWQTMVKNG